MPRRRSWTESPWIQASPFLIAIAAFVGGMLLNAYTIADKIATKPYVEDRIIDTKKYADERDAQVLKEAFEHSDMNRQIMALDLEKYSSTVKSLEVKIDAINDNLNRLFKQLSSRDHIK